MQPQTLTKIGSEEFNRLKKTVKIKSIASSKRKINPEYSVPIPEEVGIQLTYRCNLRCKHCFQWNQKGLFQKLDNETQKKDIDIEIIEKILRETFKIKSNLFLWGGEPLIHSEWPMIAALLERDQRSTVLCTNGLLLQKQLDSILRISSNLVLLISIDGFTAQNDSIRGIGSYNKLIENINILLYLKNKGEYKGKISLNCVISESMVDKLYDFMNYCESLDGVDTVYFCFPWFISNEIAHKMDDYFNINFSWLQFLEPGYVASWHSYAYHLDISILDLLKNEIRKLNSKIWKTRIRIQPALKLDEIECFLLGKEIKVQKRCQCLAVSNRMDVLADGSVSSCKNFPEFIVGDLYRQGVIEIWQSEKFSHVRKIINGGLMPVCSKCILLYLNGQ